MKLHLIADTVFAVDNPPVATNDNTTTYWITIVTELNGGWKLGTFQVWSRTGSEESDLLTKDLPLFELAVMELAHLATGVHTYNGIVKWLHE